MTECSVALSSRSVNGFSITALMGVLMVIGIAVSNGILLVDDANRRLNEGTEKVEAIIAAARSRFVPIAMTSLATIIGLIPTAMALEEGSEANQPLALAVVGGLTSSTVLSLFLVPVMFMFLAKRPSKEEVEQQRQPLLIFGNLPFTLLVILPTNKRLQALAPASADPGARRLIETWARLHLVRDALGLTATAAYLWAGP